MDKMKKHMERKKMTVSRKILIVLIVFLALLLVADIAFWIWLHCHGITIPFWRFRVHLPYPFL